MCKSAATLTCSSSSGTAGKNAIKPDTSKDPDRPTTQNNKKQLPTMGNETERERDGDSADRQLRVTIDMNEPVFAGT